MGCNKKWTEDYICKEALKYKNKKDFRLQSSGIYKSAWRYGILDKACSHMSIKKRKTKYKKWTNEIIHKEALKYSMRIEFQKYSKSAYSLAHQRGILDKVCNHMLYGKGGFKKDRSAILYYLSINNGELFKIGITNKTIEYRYTKTEQQMFKILKIWEFKDGKDALKKEREIILKYNNFKYMGKPIFASGNSEIFIKNILNIE